MLAELKQIAVKSSAGTQELESPAARFFFAVHHHGGMAVFWRKWDQAVNRQLRDLPTCFVGKEILWGTL
jgi:hypothetical protein